MTCCYQHTISLFSTNKYAVSLIIMILITGTEAQNNGTPAGQFPAGVPLPARRITIRSVKTSAGFIHPGIAFTPGQLRDVRDLVIAGHDPWYSYYCRFTPKWAKRTIRIHNENPLRPGFPKDDAFDDKRDENMLRHDAATALRQALLYFFTGDEIYRRNAMRIIRVWSKLDPVKFKGYREHYIHGAHPVRDLIMAAELMRYTPSRDARWAWTLQDTTDFSYIFVIPALATFFSDPGHFMNQGGFPLTAAIAADIFLDDDRGYARHIEWFTVNRRAPNQGWAFSIRNMARLVT
ncbi:MAG: hypothetical protein D6820_11490, partial [Lentisphaerae bacterium]